MKRAIAAAMIASTMLAGLAAARAETAHGAAAASDASRSMDAPYIAVPVVRNGVLVNYLFVTLRVDISPSVDLWRTREKAHFLRDALIRTAHNTPMADAARDDQLNTPVALAAFRAAAAQSLGPQAVRNLTIVSTYSAHRPIASRN
ncbi:MAG: hypothetical protein AB7L65_05840 [Hyphomonadaceae bacterium]